MTTTRLILILSTTLLAACGGDDGASPDGPPAGRRANASSVGAKTVNGPSPARAVSSPVASRAPTSVVKVPALRARSTTVVGVAPSPPAGAIAGLDAATLETVLRYHVVAGDVRASDVVTLTEATPLAGGPLAIEVAGTDVYLNAGTRVTTTDLVADNGVVHVIDSVLLPQATAFPGTLTDALAAYPRFSTLVGAATTAEVADDLATTGGAGLTLFAPTNQAFDALDVDLGALTPAQLANVLTYHVVPGTVDAAAVVGLSSAATLQGQTVAIAVDAGAVTLNGTTHVTYTDRRTSNGIFHVIDGVLLPAAE